MNSQFRQCAKTNVQDQGDASSPQIPKQNCLEVDKPELVVEGGKYDLYIVSVKT